MSDADQAYAKAERLIAKAKADEAAYLGLEDIESLTLETLPPKIATLTSLEHLELDNTGVFDLSPLIGLTSLTGLWLNGTQVSDLSPLSGLTSLTELMLNGTQVSDLGPLSGLRSLTQLWLHGTQVSDISPLSGQTSLVGLWLGRTQVSDVHPLSGLTSLTELRLDGTNILDMRPLRGLRRLADDPGSSGLTFKDCAAARRDAEIARISEIEDNSERARALFDYLEDWEPPRAGNTPEPDPLFAVDTQDGRLEIPASVPNEAERDERLKQVLHQRLRDKSRALAQAAGNRFFRLAARARALGGLVEADFADVDLLMLHLAVDDLRDLERLGREDEDGEPFPPEIQVALGDVLRIGPGLTLGHPEVDELVRRANARRDALPVPEEEIAAQDAMSARLIEAVDAIGPRLIALEKAVIESSSEEDREAQKGAHRSVLWRIGVFALSLVNSVGTGVAVSLLSPPIISFVEANLPMLKAVAATYGPQFYDWFVASLAQSKDFVGLLDKQTGREKR